MKKNNLHKIAVLVTMIIGLCCYAGAQTTFSSGDLTYQVNPDGNSVKVIGYNYGLTLTSVTIPSTVSNGADTYFVTQVGANAFLNHSTLRYVHFPNTMVIIGANAFRNTDLRELTLPDAVQRIEAYAFDGCHNMSGNLTIPNTLTYIGDYAFNECYHFSGALTLPNSVTYIGQYAFHNTDFTSLSLPNSIEVINAYAFSSCDHLTGTLTIPNSVWKIEEGAFISTGFSGFVFSNSLKEIGERAFADCSWADGRTLTLPNSLETIGNYAFSQSWFTGSLTIPNSVQTIGYGAFNHTTTGTQSFNGGKLTIGNSVSEIGGRAFKNCDFSEVECMAVNPPYLENGTSYSDGPFDNVPCTTLTVLFGCTSVYSASADWSHHFTNHQENPYFTAGDYDCYATNTSHIVLLNYNGNTLWQDITIPTSINWLGSSYPVKELGDGIFSSTDISSVTIFDGMESIGANAFKSCQWLTDVWVLALTPPALGAGAFTDISTNTLRVQATCVSAYTNSTWAERFSNIIGVTLVHTVGNLRYSITGSNTVTVIGHVDASYTATGSLNIPSSVTINGQNYTVTEIGDEAFLLYEHLTGTLTIPNTVTRIGNKAFSSCGLTGTLTIPNSVTSIGYNAFAFCSGFTGSLNIPNSVEELGSCAFMSCYGFNGTLTLPDNLTAIHNNTFYGCHSLTGVLTIPSTMTDIGLAAFMGCSGFTGTLTIPNSVTSISDFAFYGCSGFTGSLIIPNHVTVIENHAFENCSGFTSLEIGGNVNEIQQSAFAGCSGITGDVVVSAALPPIFNTNGQPISAVFENVPSTTLRVPFGSRQAYTQSDWTVHFTTFIEDEYAVIGEYRYHGNSGNTLTVVEHLDGVAATGFKTIPGIITVNGSTYTVNAIGEDVFKGSNISGVNIPSTITSIGANAISNCPNLINVEVKATTPPALGNNTFNNIPCYSLMVPCGCTAAYESSPWADYFIYFYEDCTGVDDVAEENTLNIYPNPSHSIVKIEADNIKNVSIFNTLGQQIFNSKASGDAFEYNFNGNTGMYLIRVETDKGVETKRIVVM